jgi:peptidoglycan/xylan/chitin deacetylase (PgdA/CDA1 family)
MNPRPKKLQVLRWLPDALMLTTGPAAGPALYLTFDDGPHPQHTQPVLDVLAANAAHASFFVLGEQVEKHPRIVERIVAAGHRLGNHSYDHPDFTRIPGTEQQRQIEYTDSLLAAFDGQPAHRFRPPSGRFPLSLLVRRFMRRRNITYWSYDSLDYQRAPVERMVDVMRRHPPRVGDIVLMHDDNETTARALEILLPEWRAAGFELHALPAMG